MTTNTPTLYQQLIAAGHDDAQPSDTLKQRVLQTVRLVPDASCGSADAASREAHFTLEPPGRRRLGRLLMASHKKSVRYGALAAAAAILAAIGLWPTYTGKPGTTDQWWLSPPAACAQQIRQAMAAIKAITCREQTVWIHTDGSRSTSSTWNKYYSSSDSYRRDIYDGDFLREVQWYVPEESGMAQTGFRNDTRSYFTVHHRGSYASQDPVERMRALVALVDKAEKILDSQQIDYHQCVGFEIQAGPEEGPVPSLNRIWFDVQTRLPVRVEFQRPQTDPKLHLAGLIIMQDRFDFSLTVPADTFTPWYPSGYIYAHPDQLQTQATQPAQ